MRQGLGLALGALGRSLEGTKTTDLLEDSLGVEFRLEALESAIDGFALTDNNFRHVNSPAFFCGVWRVPQKRAGVKHPFSPFQGKKGL